jgi:hypothetical protein
MRCITKLERNGKFKHINDIFYEKHGYGINLSRFGAYNGIVFKLEIQTRDG